jgi:cytidylate kinase
MFRLLLGEEASVVLRDKAEDRLNLVGRGSWVVAPAVMRAERVRGREWVDLDRAQSTSTGRRLSVSGEIWIALSGRSA